jgi:hypothetical protein
MNLPDSTATLIVPFASAEDEACQTALAGLALPHLEQITRRWHAGPVQGADAYCLNTPHEQALAHVLGWDARPDGTLPLAAWSAQRQSVGCAWFEPCHWTVGMEQVRLQPADTLQVQAEESLALLAALQPWAEADGLQLIFERPERWRAEGAALADLPWASMDRVANRRLDGWLPDASQHPGMRPLLRLHNEAQMLFYTHPVNDRRSARGLAPINGCWISACGLLAPHERLGPAPDIDYRLRPAARAGHWRDWAQAWQGLERDVLPVWLARAASGVAVQIIFCGERGWQAWHSQPQADSTAPPAAPAWWRRWWPAQPVPFNPAGILGPL